MDFAPLQALPPVIQVHVISAVLAISIGPFVLLRKRHDRLHKCLGYVWVLSMLSVAISGLFIPGFALQILGHFGPIHAFVVLTLFSLWKGMAAIFRGNIRRHRAYMSGLYWNGLLVAGAVNFLPGRAINRTLFPAEPQMGYVVLAAIIAALLWFRVIRPRFLQRVRAA